jgi:hypothetical protein
VASKWSSAGPPPHFVTKLLPATNFLELRNTSTLLSWGGCPLPFKGVFLPQYLLPEMRPAVFIERDIA